jgi:hypothetical protein
MYVISFRKIRDGEVLGEREKRDRRREIGEEK